VSLREADHRRRVPRLSRHGCKTIEDRQLSLLASPILLGCQVTEHKRLRILQSSSLHGYKVLEHRRLLVPSL
jgi:hypothetical protein